MTLRLRRPTAQFPAGGWQFKCPFTGYATEPYQGGPEWHAAKIIAVRKANPHIIPGEPQWLDVASVVQEIYREKAKTAPQLFVDSNQPVAPRHPTIVAAQSKSKCACGATETTVEYCKSCGGRKVIGFKCVACGVIRRR